MTVLWTVRAATGLAAARVDSPLGEDGGRETKRENFSPPVFCVIVGAKILRFAALTQDDTFLIAGRRYCGKDRRGRRYLQWELTIYNGQLTIIVCGIVYCVILSDQRESKNLSGHDGAKILRFAALTQDDTFLIARGRYCGKDRRGRRSLQWELTIYNGQLTIIVCGIVYCVILSDQRESKNLSGDDGAKILRFAALTQDDAFLIARGRYCGKDRRRRRSLQGDRFYG